MSLSSSPIADFQNGAAVRESAFGADGRGWTLLFLAALLFLGACLGRTLRDPWVEEDTWYGAVYSQAAHNNLRAGLGVTAGVPVTLYFGPLPFSADAYYVHHPTLLPLLVTASFAVFGEAEAAARLTPIACSLLTVFLLWTLLRDALGRRTAALACLIFATLPMQVHYGDMVDFEPPLLMLMLATLTCLMRWRKAAAPAIWAWAAGACAFLCLWMDWPAYLFVSMLAVWLWRRGERRFALVLVGLALVSAAVFLLQVQYVNPSGLSDLATAVKMRLGNGTTPGSSAPAHEDQVHFTVAQWCATVAHGFHEDYLPIPLLLAFAGFGTVILRAKHSSGLRRVAKIALLIGGVGGSYMVILRNWSFIHDWASFYLTVPVAILGGVALDRALAWQPGFAPRFARTAVAVGVVVFAIGSGVLGVRQSDAMRSQFLILDGRTPEPRRLAADLGRALAATFSPQTTILCNFDPYGSALTYYAQRMISTGVATVDDWQAQVAGEAGPVGGVVWTGAPEAGKLIASLPQGELQPLIVDGVRFMVWKPKLRPEP